jgi:hypothetical protein
MYVLATLAFGFSRTFWPMFLALAVTGSADTVSAVLRNIVRQLETPDHLRGRMVGISMLFFMGGPQLGEFEAGAVAQWLGAGLAPSRPSTRSACSIPRRPSSTISGRGRGS